MRFALALLLFLTAAPALAVQPDEVMADPVMEARARDISRQLRCLVCQGEAIDESNAELAADLRRLVRARLDAGDSDGEVLAYIQQRYGDYVLMRPPLGARTLVLWLSPFALLALGGYIVWRRTSQGGAAEDAG